MNMLVSGAALLLACTAFAGYELTDFRQTLVQRLAIQAQIVGANSVTALLFNDPAAARDTLSALSKAPQREVGGDLHAGGRGVCDVRARQGSGGVPGQTAAPVQAEEYRFTSDELILTRVIGFQGKRHRHGADSVGSAGTERPAAAVYGHRGPGAGVSLLAAFRCRPFFRKLRRGRSRSWRRRREWYRARRNIRSARR